MQEFLKGCKKGSTWKIASRVLKNLKKAGIGAYVYLLFGTPEETEKEARKTLDFAVRHGEEIGFLNLAIFNLPAYGEEAQEAGHPGFLRRRPFPLFPFRPSPGWNRDAVRLFLDKEFKRHPAIAPILRRDPPIFTSNHAAFFLESAESTNGEKKLVDPFNL